MTKQKTKTDPIASDIKKIKQTLNVLSRRVSRLENNVKTRNKRRDSSTLATEAILVNALYSDMMYDAARKQREIVKNKQRERDIQKNRNLKMLREVEKMKKDLSTQDYEKLKKFFSSKQSKK